MIILKILIVIKMTEYVYLSQIENTFSVCKSVNIYKKNNNAVKPIILALQAVENCNSVYNDIISKFKMIFTHIKNNTFEFENKILILSEFQKIVSSHTILNTFNGFLIESNNKHNTYSIKWAKNTISNWEFNRPADEERVNEIYNSFYNTYLDKTVVVVMYEGMINCIDGNHRRLVFDKILSVNPHENINVILKVFYNKSHKEINDIFISLNKAVPVSSLYSNEAGELNVERSAIERIVNTFISRYKPFIMTSNKPRFPHTNKTLLEEFIISNLKNGVKIEEMFERMKQASDKNKTEYLKVKKDNTIFEKCQIYDMYLFINSQNYLM